MQQALQTLQPSTSSITQPTEDQGCDDNFTSLG